MLTCAALCRREVNALLEAIRFFTRLPAPVWGEFQPVFSARAARYLPWVGFLVGGLAGLVPTPQWKRAHLHAELAQLERSGGFAFHVSGEFSALELQFWAIRN